MNFLAKFFTVLLHPLLMPTYFVFIIFNSGTNLSFMSFKLQLMVYGLIFLFTFLLPLLLMPILLIFKIIKSINLEDHQERVVPMLATALTFMVAYFILFQVSIAVHGIILRQYLLAATVSVLLTLAVTTKWKISAHMVGIGGNTGAVITLSLKLMSNMIPVLLILIILSGILGTSRLQLKAHSPEQVYAGYGLGIATVLIITLFI
jgi:membrane-associated phospholipid phosphatase